MGYEIRPVTADEADEFVRAIPGGAGLPTAGAEAGGAGPADRDASPGRRTVDVVRVL